MERTPFNFDEDDGVLVVYGIYTDNGKKKSEIQSIKFYHDKGNEKEVKGSEDYYSVIINDSKPTGQILFDSDKDIKLEFAGNDDKFITTFVEYL